MGRGKKGDIKTVSFTIQRINDEKLDNIAHAEGMNRSEFIDKMIEGYQFISFDVEQRKIEVEKAIQAENQAHSTRIKELEEKRLELAKIGKQKRILDKAMVSRKEEYVLKLIDAINRGSSYEGLDAIAKEGQRVSGVDPVTLLSEAMDRRKK